MSDIAGKTHHIRIDGKGYMLREQEAYVVTEAPIFGVTRFSTGDPSYNDSTLGRWWAQTDWSGGVRTNDDKWRDDATFRWSTNMDIYKKFGEVRPVNIMADSCEGIDANQIVLAVCSAPDYPSFNSMISYILASDSNNKIAIYRRTGPKTISKVHTDSNTTSAFNTLDGLSTAGVNCCEFNKKLLWFGRQYIGRYDATSDSWNDNFKQLTVQLSTQIGKRLYLAGQSIISSLDTSDVWVDNAMIIPNNENIMAMESFGNGLWIGTDRGNIYEWNLKDDPSLRFKLPSEKIKWLKKIGGYLYVATQSVIPNEKSKLYLTNSVSLNKVYDLPGRPGNFKNVIEYKGMLVFILGVTDDSSDGIWAYNPSVPNGSLSCLSATTNYASSGLYIQINLNGCLYYDARDYYQYSYGPFMSGYGQIQGTPWTTYYLNLTWDDANGWNGWSGSSSTYGTLISHFFDANLPAIDKLWSECVIKGSEFGYTEIYYSTETSDYSSSTTWTLLGTINGGGEVSKTFKFSSAVVSKGLRYKIISTASGMKTGSNTAIYPVSKDISFRYFIMPVEKYSFDLKIMASGNEGSKLKLLNGTTEKRTGEEILGELMKLRSTKAIVEYEDLMFATTTLNGSHNSTVTTIKVNSTEGFPAAGKIIIDNEEIWYTGKTLTQFTGCVRASRGTEAATHTTGSIVSNKYKVVVYQIGQSIPALTEKSKEIIAQIRLLEV